jgi:hypothetical protein
LVRKNAAASKAASAKPRHERKRPLTTPELLHSLRPGGGYFAPQVELAKAKDR